MANTKTTDLTAITAPVGGDKIHIVDVSDITDDAAGSSKQISLTNLSKGILGTNIDVTGFTVSELLRTNAGGTAVESAGKTVPTGDIVGTTDTQTLTNKTIASHLAYADTRSKVITSIRSIAGTSGDVAYTGVGFVPTSIIAFVSVAGTTIIGSGVADSAKGSGSIEQTYQGNAGSDTTNFIDILTASGAGQSAIVKSYDADGFTLTWTKTGADTGTITLIFLCLK